MDVRPAPASCSGPLLGGHDGVHVVLSRGGRRVATVLCIAGAVTGCGTAGREAPRATSTASRTATAPVPSTPAPASQTASPPPQASRAACDLPLSTWPVEALAGAVLTAPVRVEHLDQAIDIAGQGIGGVILYGSSPPPSLPATLAVARKAAPRSWRLLVASDEEGGDIQRLGPLIGRMPWPRDQSRLGSPAVRDLGQQVGQRLQRLGVTVDLAPVADLDDGDGPDLQHPAGRRSYSADPAVASSDVSAFVTGLQSGGVAAVVKHFPGLGTADGNTDASVSTTASWAQIQGRDLAPFTAAIQAGVKGVMVSLALVPGLTEQPAALSPAVMRVLRQDLRFRGVVFTDSLSAGAVSGARLGVPDAAVRALQAGADDVLFGTGETTDGAALAGQVKAAVIRAVNAGALSRARLQEAAWRVAVAQGSTPC